MTNRASILFGVAILTSSCVDMHVIAQEPVKSNPNSITKSNNDEQEDNVQATHGTEDDDLKIKNLLIQDEPAACKFFAKPFADINDELNSLITYSKIVEDCTARLSKDTYLLLINRLQNLLNKLETPFFNAELWDHISKLYYKIGNTTKALLAAEQAVLYSEERPVPERLRQFEELKTKQASEPPKLRALIVGGGPSRPLNQAAIESNVRYVSELLFLESFPFRTLFTDGDADSKTVQCQRSNKMLYYRKPDVPRIDGPSVLPRIQTELALLSEHANKAPNIPLFIYFTGHGSADSESNFNNNKFDLWAKGAFTVKDFASSLKLFPKNTPITVVMVQCFSGSFANILFDNGDPKGNLTDLNICGFFSGIPQRETAGCTPELNESYYRDFSCYFFAALSGMDRLGKQVSGADYNNDGRVTMDEAFAYTLINDVSIDTPICTSDIYLRRFVPTSQENCFKRPYAEVRKWATPAQLAALDGLYAQLKFSDADPLRKAYDLHQKQGIDDSSIPATMLIRFVNLVQTIVLTHDLQLLPDGKIKNGYLQLIKLEHTNPLVS